MASIASLLLPSSSAAANELFQVTRDLLFTSHTNTQAGRDRQYAKSFSCTLCVASSPFAIFQSGQWLAKLLLLLMLMLLHVRKYIRRRSPGG